MKFNKKTRKFILPLAVGLGSATILPAIFATSCVNNGLKNEFADSKEIVIAMDGVQKKFYEEVERQFNNSDVAKKDGFKLRIVERDVWGSIDRIKASGATDKENPDIVYAPQDRVTTLLQEKSISELTTVEPKFYEKLFEALKFTKEEQDIMKDFGNVQYVQGNTPKSGYYAIPHNKEGIIMVSNKDETEMKKELKNPSLDTLKELVESGKAFFRIQDFWYGNGVFAGAAGEKNIDKIAYKKNNKWQSGFIIGNEHHGEFKKGIKAAAELIWPIYNAAYIMDETTYKNSVWGQKGISQGELRDLLKNDMGLVNNTVSSLLKTNKLEYAIIGTWDVNVAINDWKAKGFLNVVDVKDDEGNKKVQYLQAPGSWSFLINVRNNGVSKERQKALFELIKIMLSKEAYFKYFTQDSKVPLYPTIQTEVKKLNAEKAAEDDKEFVKLWKDKLKYPNIETFEAAYKKILSSLRSLKSRDFNEWKIDGDEKNADAINDKNQKEIVKPNASDLFPEATSEFKATYDKTDLGKTTGLTNFMAAVLGISLKDYIASTEGGWKINAKDNPTLYKVHPDLMKKISDNKDLEEKEKELADLLKTICIDENHYHIRKIEQYVFGADGDSSGQKDALAEKIINSLYANGGSQEKYEKEILTPAFNKLKLVQKYIFAKAEPTSKEDKEKADAKLKKAIEVYLNGYKARAAFGNIVTKYIESTSFKTYEQYKVFKLIDAKEDAYKGNFASLWENGGNVAPTSTYLKELEVIDDTQATEYDKLKDSTIGIVNLLTTGLNVEMNETNVVEHWKLPETLFKTPLKGATDDTYGDKANKLYSVRKVADLVFGSDFENVDKNKAFISNASETLDTLKAKVKDFAKTYAKTPKTDAELDKATEDFFASFMKTRKAIEYIDTKIKTLGSSSASEKIANTEVIEKYELYLKNKSIDKILQLMTSSKEISSDDKDALGIFKTQKARIDHGNPQFGAIWGIWNDETFGNAKLYTEWAEKKVNTFDKFFEAVEKQLSDRFDVKTKVLDKDNLKDHISLVD